MLSIQVGQCGSRNGLKFWEILAKEHGIDENGQYIGNSKDQLSHICSYFNEGVDRYVPRTIFIDLDPRSEDSVKASSLGSLFSPGSFLSGKAGGMNNFAIGYYIDGSELIDPFLDIVRHEAEKSDIFIGAQLAFSVGGGSGSGIGANALRVLKEEHFGCLFQSSIVLPSPKVSDIVIEPYNAVLALHKICEYPRLNLLYDNEALHDICTRNFNNMKPTYADLNRIISASMVNLSSTMRFPSQISGGLRKIATNLIPFPRLNFLSPSLSPLEKFQNYQPTQFEIIQKLFNPENWLISHDLHWGMTYAAALILRGDFSPQKTIEELNNIKYQNDYYFDWISDNFFTAICNTPSLDWKMSASMLTNSTYISKILNNIVDAFTEMFRKKAYLHWYTQEGMDEMEFVEAESDLLDLISQYSEMDGADFGDEEDYEDEE
ncbi:unnamed protein product [Blepharisma stoltei]|uniref:Tubulin beta chain n=1 Tax=Blepharisma stoltei TaxID=1481888 RepID=A0AAU9K8G2_9CILI|nr:unnamed protein product [Blepharisma stoltei]